MADNGKRVYTPADLVAGASTARAGKLGGNPYRPKWRPSSISSTRPRPSRPSA